MSVTAMTMAMLLTGAGEMQRQPPPPPMVHPPIIAVPLPPVPYFPPIPAPPAPPPPPGPPQAVVPPQRARANLNSYFSADDYPAAAERARHEGTAGFQLEIGPDGRVANCLITVSSGSSPLDTTTCRILRRRARYRPASINGAPASGSDRGRVTWRLDDEPVDRAGLAMTYIPAELLTPHAEEVVAADVPPGLRAPAGPETISWLRVAIGRVGQVIGCDIERSSGAAALDAAACRLFSARARFAPGRTQAGAAVCDVAWLSIDWTPVLAGRPQPPPGTRAPAARAPQPLRQQLSARLCPGWSPS